MKRLKTLGQILLSAVIALAVLSLIGLSAWISWVFTKIVCLIVVVLLALIVFGTLTACIYVAFLAARAEEIRERALGDDFA